MAKILSLNVNGVDVPVVFESSKSLPVVSLKLVFKASGSVSDGAKAGLARLAGAMLEEGCASMGSEKYAKELERRAASIYSSVSKERFSLCLECLKEHYDFALSMLKKTLAEPNLNEADFNKRKELSLGEILSEQNDNDYLCRVNLIKHAYAKTPLATPVMGYESSVAKISLDDVKDFLSEHMGLENVYLVLGGDISESEVRGLADLLSTLKRVKPKSLGFYRPLASQNIKDIIKKTQQAYINFISPFDVKVGDKFKARVATFILGESGFGSRIMEEVRVKRGLAYSAYARGVIAPSHSHIYGYLQTKNQSADEAIKVVRDEFEKFIKNGVSEAELGQAKSFLQGSLPLTQETLFSRLNIADSEFYERGELGGFMQDLERISKLSLDEINEFIKSHAEISELSFAVLKQ